jgi:hypothetical protein
MGRPRSWDIPKTSLSTLSDEALQNLLDDNRKKLCRLTARTIDRIIEIQQERAQKPRQSESSWITKTFQPS